MQVSNISRKNPSFPYFAPRKHVAQEHIGKQPGKQATEMSTLTEQWIGSFETKANRQWTEVARPLSRRSWGGTRDKPKNVCVGG